MNAGRTLSLSATIAIFLTVSMGGYTTQTGSGLACPDWPLCHGKLFPQPMTAALLIEWTHRLLAALSGLLLVSTVLYLLLRRRKERGLVAKGLLALLLLMVQIWLGGLVVLQELVPVLVTLHLSVAVATFGMMVVLTTSIWDVGMRAQARDAKQAP
ncbi:MAG: hypothetical protein C4339_00505 [Nitrososphaerota archaeon]